MLRLWLDRLVPETVQMHQGSETAVAAALGRLRAEDERVAGDAEAALASLTWDQGLQAITQHGLQRFLWYELPRKWLTDLEGKLHIAASLGRLLELVGCAATRRSAVGLRPPRCCRRTSAAIGRAFRSFRRAQGALRSGAAGPARATAVVRLGPAIDEQEAGAFFSVAAALELAVAGGELRPGARGWRAAQQAVARRHLATPRPELDGHSWLELVVAERLGGWARSRGEARRALVEPVLPRLAGRPLLPLPVPPGAEGRWPRCAGCWHLRARVGESR
jgi:hypothetical protein